MPVSISELLQNTPYEEQFLEAQDGFPFYNDSQNRTEGISFRDGYTGATEVDHIVRTKSELQDLFPSGLSDGDVVQIDPRNTPIRTDQWLDIENSNVTVIGSGSNLDIYVADGGNVGGFRIGQNSEVSNVSIRRVRYHGNQPNQDQSVKALDGVLIINANHCVVEECYISWTSPKDEHHSGGSGVTVKGGNNNRGNVIRNSRFYENGDRQIQTAGTGTRIIDNHCSTTYDRSIAVNVKDPREPNGTSYPANYTYIKGNLCRDHSHGSGIGGNGPDDSKGHIITQNTVRGQNKGGVVNAPRDGTGPSGWVIANNYILQEETPIGTPVGPAINVPPKSVAVGNVCRTVSGLSDEWDWHIFVAGTATVANNLLESKNQSLGIYSEAPVQIEDNTLIGFNVGIRTEDFATNPTQIIGNNFRETYDTGIIVGDSQDFHTIRQNDYHKDNSSNYFVDARGRSQYSGILVMEGNYDNPGRGYTFSNSTPAQYNNNVPPIWEQEAAALSVSSGGAQTLTLNNFSLGDIPEVELVPNSSGNDTEFQVDAIMWDDANNDLKVRIIEKADAGGGTVLVRIRRKYPR